MAWKHSKLDGKPDIMPMIKTVLGLDLGSQTLKAVELRQTLRGLEPVQFRLHPRTDPDLPLEEEIRRFVAEHDLPTEQVVVALPADRLSIRRLVFPFRDGKRITAAVPFEIEGLVPFELEDVIVDWEVVGEHDGQASVATSIAQRGDVAEYLEGYSAADCEPRILEAEGLVLANLASVFDLEGSRLLVDFGHTHTRFTLLCDGKAVTTRSIRVGGLALTEAIAKDRGLGMDEAERVKCEEGVFDIGFGSASQTALGLLDRVAREAMRMIEGLEPVQGPATPAVSSIVLFGGGSRLARIDEYLAERTGVPTARLALPADPEQAGLAAGGDPLLFAPALALALRGTANATTRVNFRQDEFAYRTNFGAFFGPDMRPTLILGAIALVLFAVSVFTGISLQSSRAGRLEESAAALYTEAFPNESAPANPMAAMRTALDSAHERADFLGVYSGNRSALNLLAEISSRVPPDLEVKFDEVAIDRRVIRIKVFTRSLESVEALKNALTSAPPFTEARISGEIKIDRKRGGRTFSLNIPLPVGGES